MDPTLFGIHKIFQRLRLIITFNGFEACGDTKCLIGVDKEFLVTYSKTELYPCSVTLGHAGVNL